MDIFSIVTGWFWLGCLIVTILNGGLFQFRANKRIKKNPELAEGYQKIIKGFITLGNLPWIVMGIGCTIGDVPTVFHYFRPRDGNPWVLAFFLSVFLVWILGTHWLFFRDGAQILVNHPGLLNYDFKNPIMVKFLWIVCLAGGVIAVVMMYTQTIPVPIK